MEVRPHRRRRTPHRWLLAHPDASPSPAPQEGRWGAGRVTTVVLAVVTFLVAGGLLTAGATVALAGATLRDDEGYLMSRFTTLTTPGAAVSSESLRLRSDASSTLPRRLLGDAKVEVRAPSAPAGVRWPGPNS